MGLSQSFSVRACQQMAVLWEGKINILQTLLMWQRKHLNLDTKDAFISVGFITLRQQSQTVKWALLLLGHFMQFIKFQI